MAESNVEDTHNTTNKFEEQDFAVNPNERDSRTLEELDYKVRELQDTVDAVDKKLDRILKEVAE